MSGLVYVYAVVPRPVGGDLKGIDQRPVRFITHDGLAAAVSEVPAEDFDEEPLNEHVRDLGWLGPRALAHQDVNYRLHEDAEAVVPLAFGTVYRDEDRVRQLLRDQSAALHERLDAVKGCGEWVIALHALQELDSEHLERESPALQELQHEIETTTPGRAHLLKRRLAELEREEARRVQAEAAARLLEQLKTVAVDLFSEDLPRETAERPLVRASVLVRRADESSWLETVERLRQRWPEPAYRINLTGPWPPYRFGGLPGHTLRG